MSNHRLRGAYCIEMQENSLYPVYQKAYIYQHARGELVAAIYMGRVEGVDMRKERLERIEKYLDDLLPERLRDLENVLRDYAEQLDEGLRKEMEEQVALGRL